MLSADIRCHQKYYCTTNITNYKVDSNLISDIKEKFNNSLEQANSFILKELDYAQKYVDSESAMIIHTVYESILVYLNCQNINFQRNTLQTEIRNPIRGKIREVHKKYKVLAYAPEVFWLKHGLNFANQKMLNYISKRDIVDVGAYCGDSLLIFLQYTNKTVFSYEISPANLHFIDETIVDNRLDKKRIQIINKAITNENRRMQTDFEFSQFSMIKEKAGGFDITLTTLDDESKRLKMNIGFLKINIVGMELLALQGALKTIRKNRPIISVSIFYNFECLFKVRHFIDNNLVDYSVKYEIGSWMSGSFGELIIFAYPKELSD